MLYNVNVTVRYTSVLFGKGDGVSYDGAEVCELVGPFILNDLCNEYGKDNIGLYRDDGLAIFKDTSGPQAERIRKDITRRFKTHGLNITIQTNMKLLTTWTSPSTLQTVPTALTESQTTIHSTSTQSPTTRPTS